MPGGRLTYTDRQQIAAGLADGLSHAEIARRLDRPTSTITREVTRNGGAAGYRARDAHASTERRARRARPPAAQRAAELPATSEHGRDTRAVRDFEEFFTGVLVYTGVPRMPARVLTCLFVLDSGSLTAAELAQRLRVSPASVSKAVALLEEQSLLRREQDGRRERYIIDDDTWFRSWEASARMNGELAKAAQEGAKVLGADTPAGARLDDMAQFLQHVVEEMVRYAEGWWRSKPARHAPDSGTSGNR
jgi:DNA-binding transcriptional regulator GbsR (MarR family)